MKTILVPTDFSTAAENAVEYATAMAKEMSAKIILLHTYHVPMPATEAPIMMLTSDEMQKESEDQLQKEAKRLQEKYGVEISCIARMGFAADEILDEQKNVQLIVMGKNGASKLSEVLLGSITSETLRKAKIPVLVVPDKVKYITPKKIVFACDYNPKTNLKTLDTLKELTKTFGSKIYVVNIQKKNEEVTIEKNESVVNLDIKLSDVEHIYFFPEKDDLVEGINEFVEEKQADMIAIIPHHYNLIENLFHKSISKKMAFHTHVPLLSLPDNHTSIPVYFL